MMPQGIFRINIIFEIIQDSVKEQDQNQKSNQIYSSPASVMNLLDTQMFCKPLQMVKFYSCMHHLGLMFYFTCLLFSLVAEHVFSDIVIYNSQSGQACGDLEDTGDHYQCPKTIITNAAWQLYIS